MVIISICSPRIYTPTLTSRFCSGKYLWYCIFQELQISCSVWFCYGLLPDYSTTHNVTRCVLLAPCADTDLVWAAVTPVKFECDLKNVTGIYARSLMEKLTNGALDSGNSLLPHGTMPLPGLILTYHQKCGIHLMPVWQEMLTVSIPRICLKIVNIGSQLHLPETAHFINPEAIDLN